uniref:Uncharacterized protein n=1 Tax=Cacopsylla melanoneura TaxID=428564 RepID=A0A8D8ULQ7_9HEMI
MLQCCNFIMKTWYLPIAYNNKKMQRNLLNTNFRNLRTLARLSCTFFFGCTILLYIFHNKKKLIIPVHTHLNRFQEERPMGASMCIFSYMGLLVCIIGDTHRPHICIRWCFVICFLCTYQF